MRIKATLLFFLASLCFVHGQDLKMKLTLTEVVALAKSDAPDVLLAKTRLNNNYWIYQSFLANYKPQITLDATLPNLNRTITPITFPDGTIQFIRQGVMNNGIGISLSQDIAATGGNIFASTGLERIDIFKTDLNPAQKQYLTNPIVIGFNQPLFGFNALKWNKKIEPLRYKEASAGYAEQMEQVATRAANLFFDVLRAQLNVEASLKDKENADNLYEKSKGRFSVGRIAETELLQMELSAMNSNSQLSQAKLNLSSTTEELRNFLGINQVVNFELVPPFDLPDIYIDEEKALEYARKFRSKNLEFERRLAEANRNVAQAKGETGININVFGRIGLSQTGGSIGEAYEKPLDDERIAIGIGFPIADWGKAKARNEIAQSTLQLTAMNIEQEKISFEREIIIRVQQFELLKDQVEIAKRSYEIAQKRQELTRNRYLIGKINSTDLNLAIIEQDNSRRNYISALRSYWQGYYDIRRLTLYDFENNEPLFVIPKGYDQ